MVKNLPVSAGNVDSIVGRKDPLGKEMATHSSTLAWETHGQRSLVDYRVGEKRTWGHKESDTPEQLN